jgi:3-phosphoshikimate 1-carboxyvinyltransferase
MIVAGSVGVPGDKSLTHRVLFLAGLAGGTSEIRGALASLDTRSTAAVLRRLGVSIGALRSGAAVQVKSRRRFRPPVAPLDCGNSGTAARLSLGLLAAHRFTAVVTGDRSLRRRPMRRLAAPLEQMGARLTLPEADGLPATIRGGPLRPIRCELPVASAQLKTALLFAALAGGVDIAVREPAVSRDHTERLFRGLGLTLTARDGWLEFRPETRLRPFSYRVPGDPSSAAFLVGAALLAEGGELEITEVGLNPTRTAYLSVLQRMGAVLECDGAPDPAALGEPVGRLMLRPSSLRATTVTAPEVPGLIDEIPLLAVVAARAEGTSVFHGLRELRHKESDRLALLAENLRAVGIGAETQGETLLVTGTDAPPVGPVRTAGDHRIAMAFGVLGTVPGARVRVDNLQCADVSYPGFADALRSVVARRR